jgi:hypothetical protein
MATSVAPRAFYAHLFETSGVLAKVAGELTFFGDDDTIVTVEPSMINFLTVLGECGLDGAARLADRRHGGAVGVCLSRQQEVR